MALPVRHQAIYWGVAAAVFVAVLWVLGDVLLPFVLGAAIAYFLDPVADRLQGIGMSRIWAVITITLVSLLLFIALALVVIPTLVQQTQELVAAAPGFAQRLSAFLTERFPDIMDADSTVRQSLEGLGDTLRARGAEFAQQVLSGALSLVNVLILMILVPVVTFYLLLDWDNLVARVDTLLPRDHAPTIRRLASDIDRTLAGFVRGQGTVCLILGTYYAIMLMLVGLDFGLVVGFVAGALTFIPYVGALVGGVLAIGLALVQYWGEWWWIVAVWAIFQSGQFVEGNILTPKLVGQSVGLHPVWLILALSVFGALFGFIGLLVAVPLAAAIGVIARFAIERYKQSRLYTGLGPPGGPGE